MAIIVHDHRVRDSFKEEEHPRANNGQFATSAGGGGSTAPSEFSNHLKATLKEKGFTAAKKNGKKVYVHAPSGVTIEVGPGQAGKGHTSVWISNKEGKAPITGEGSGTLNKLLARAMAGQPPAPPKAEPKAEPGSGSAPSHAVLTSKGYKESSMSTGSLGTAQVYVKGDAYVCQMVSGEKAGSWISYNPGNQPKAGNTAEALEKLMSGNTSGSVSTTKLSALEALRKMTEGSAGNQGESPHSGMNNPGTGTTYSKLKAGIHTPTEAQHRAIKTYTGNAYATINQALRKNEDLASGHAAAVKNLTEYLDKASLPETVVLRRGVSGDYANILKSIMFEGAKFIDHGFSSMSTGSGFSGSLKLHITAPKGSKAAAVGHLGAHPGELEVIGQRGSVFEVTKYDRKTGECHLLLHPPVVTKAG